MKPNLRLLVLTDHRGHTAENSLYALVNTLRSAAPGNFLVVASRGDSRNDGFFRSLHRQPLYVTDPEQELHWSADNIPFASTSLKINPATFDVIWLRMPPPLEYDFLRFLEKSFPNTLIVNHPSGIWQTGSKAFLTHFPDISPPIQPCTTLADIDALRGRFPFVLKPLRQYGGQGLVRIDQDRVWRGNHETDYRSFRQSLSQSEAPIAYLGVKFLPRVTEGDKRIVVVDGKIMGASLRLPAKNSWVCNVAMGGRSTATIVEEEERQMIKRINPILAELGIMMYGVDTLVGEDGRRVLSELNTTSIGGLPQIAALNQEPLLEEAAEIIWNYMKRKRFNGHD